MDLHEKRHLFNKLNRMFDQIERDAADMDLNGHASSVSNLLKSAGYPESEIANIRRIQSEYMEALEDILPGLEMDIMDSSIEDPGC